MKYAIILTIIIALTASMLLLAQVENNQRKNNQNFWSIYFVDPIGTDNRFVIDNKTPTTQIFYYDVLVNEVSVHSGNIEIEENTRKLIKNESTQKPFEIIVTTESNIKTIYKK